MVQYYIFLYKYIWSITAPTATDIRAGPTDEEVTGFDLSIVEQGVRAHGWTLQANNADDGARFEVTDVEFGE